jgi:hypothetical protein
MRDISFQKTEYLLGSKFSLSRSLLRHERVPYPPRRNLRERLNVLEAPRREAAKCGATGVWNKAERRPPRRKNLETDTLGLEALQLIEIPQNHQSFLWKSLEGNTLFLERLGKKLGGRLDSARLHYCDPAHGFEPDLRSEFTSETRIFGV